MRITIAGGWVARVTAASAPAAAIAMNWAAIRTLRRSTRSTTAPPSSDGDDHRAELEQAEQPDERGRMREQIDLGRQRDKRDLAADSRDDLAGLDQPEVAGGAQRRDVKRDPSQQRTGRPSSVPGRAAGHHALGVVVVREEALAGLAPEPSRPHEAASAPAPAGSAPRGARRSSAQQHRQHVVEADRVGPAERTARVVEAVDHPGVDVGGAADALAERERRLVDRPGRRSGRAPGPGRRRPRRRACRAVAKNRSAASAAELCGIRPRGSARRDAPRRAEAARGSRPRRRRGRARRASRRRSRSPAARPGAARRAPRRRACRSRIRNGGSRSIASSGLEHLPARPRAATPRARSRARFARDHDRAVAAAGDGSGSGSGCAVELAARVVVVARGPDLRPWRPAATVLTVIGDGRQRGSPKLCS